jgi:hypothetical protein
MNIPLDVQRDLRRLTTEARDVVEIAESLGYTITWANHKRQIIDLLSTFNGRHLTMPTTNINANRLRTLRRQVMRHADPAVVKERFTFTGMADKNRKEGKIKPTFDIASDNDTATKRGGFPMPTAVERAMNTARLIADEEAAAEDQRLIRKANDDDEQVAELVAAERNPVYRGGDTSVHLVSETPWMVRKGGHEGGPGRMYESHSVLHRVWSDGGEDYRCRFCEYESDNPRGVSGHASRSKTGHPKAEDVEVHKVNEYHPSEIKHPMSGVRRLTTELTLALDSLKDWCDLPPETLARTLAEQVYAMRPDREPAAPLTAEQIVHRIALMVDTGRLAEMHQQVEATAAALRQAQEQCEAVSVHAATLETQVSALREERRVLAQMLSTEDDS